MKECKECGILISNSLLVTHHQTKLCKYCFKEENKKAFKFWYDKQPKKVKHIKQCIICGSQFETSQSKANVCRNRECTLKKKRLYMRIKK